MFEQITREIRVAVVPSFLEEQSEPEAARYVWAYSVTIENLGRDTVQLISRYWRITDGHGQTKEVRGPGVVGEQPTLRPGETFRYTSGTPLDTPSGFMTGTYSMRSAGGDNFEILIPLFVLDSPYHTRQIH